MSPLGDMALEPPKKWWKGKRKIPYQNLRLQRASPKPSPCSPNPGRIAGGLVPGQPNTGCHLVVILGITGRGTQSHESIILGGYLLIFSPHLTKKETKVQVEPPNWPIWSLVATSAFLIHLITGPNRPYCPQVKWPISLVACRALSRIAQHVLL